MHYFQLFYYDNCIKANIYVMLLFVFLSLQQTVVNPWILSFVNKFEKYFLTTFNEMPDANTVK